MSHFAEIRVSALTKNEKELVKALENYFGEGTVKVFAEAVQLQGMDARAKKRAHVVVKKADVAKKTTYKNAYNDLGFERMKDGTYKFHVDDMDMGEKERNSVIQDYAALVAQRQLKAQGYMVKRELEKNGKIRLTATKYA